jgi:hypothetical protein
MTSSPVAVLGRRALNRSLLARQHLLHRADSTVPAMVEALVGMQAQVPRDPYVALWSRLHGFEPDDLASMILGRSAVRATLMRGTIHLATARDALALRAVLAPVLDRLLFSGSPFGRRLGGLDLGDLLATAAPIIDERPRTRADLRRLLGERWPDHDADAMAYAVTYAMPLIQVPPRGLWGRSGQPMFARMESWLGAELPAPDPDSVVTRYLAAFGPATPADLRTWSGLTGARELVERLRPTLRTFHDETGRELFDVPDGPLPDPETRAPVRFLPEYDNILLAHADRSRMGDEKDRAFFSLDSAPGPGTVLVDGFVSGRWRLRRDGDVATLVVEMFREASDADREAIEEEGSALIAFLAADAGTRDLRIERATEVR